MVTWLPACLACCGWWTPGTTRGGERGASDRELLAAWLLSCLLYGSQTVPRLRRTLLFQHPLLAACQS